MLMGLGSGFFLAPVVTDLQITFDLQRVVYNLRFLFLPTGLISAFFIPNLFQPKFTALLLEENIAARRLQ